MVQIISLGGSIVAPDTVDVGFMQQFKALIESQLSQKPELRFILIVGGGGPARSWQAASRQIVPGISNDNQDWIGIMATRLNAELVRACFSNYCSDAVVTDPSATTIEFKGRILVAAGWKPGFSTDFDAVYLAERFKAKTVLNLSNIAKIYTDDPRTNPNAKPLDHISWAEFRSMVGSTWEPGRNVPFDPIASQKAEELALTVIAAAGQDLGNLKAIFDGQSFVGTTIS